MDKHMRHDVYRVDRRDRMRIQYLVTFGARASGGCLCGLVRARVRPQKTSDVALPTTEACEFVRYETAHMLSSGNLLRRLTTGINV